MTATHFRCLRCGTTHAWAYRIDGGFCKGCFTTAQIVRLPAREPLKLAAPLKPLKQYLVQEPQEEQSSRVELEKYLQP